MTEAEWLSSADLHQMMDFVARRVSKRKLLLFACACSQRIEQFMTDVRSRDAVRMIEIFADTDNSDLLVLAQAQAKAAYYSVYQLAIAEVPHGPSLSHAALLDALTPGLAQSYRAAHAVTQFRASGPHAMAWYVAYFSTQLFGENGWEAQQGHLVGLLRHIIGNLFRPARIDPTLLLWNDGTVRKIAQAIYDERAFERLPILADALEDAGCDNADILNHCRQPGVHVRGCWVVDLLLGKQ